MSQILTTLHAVFTDPHLQAQATALHTHVVAGSSPAPSGGPVPNVTPKLPDEVADQTQMILNWTAGISLAGAVLGSLLGWGAVGVGHNTERAALAARGKQAILWSLIAGGGIGVSAALVRAFYGMGN